jgi:8-oxo-dGTP diphosphatase
VILPSSFPIQTDRLDLRPISPEDLEGIYALYTDWEVAKTLSRLPWPFTPDEATAFLAAAERDLSRGSGCMLALIEREAGRFVGICSFRLPALETEPWTDDLGLGILGYSVMRSQWSNGFATEAAAAVTGFAFLRLGLSRVQATVIRDNIASRRVLEKLGFVIEKENIEDFPLYGGPSRLADVFSLAASRQPGSVQPS